MSQTSGALVAAPEPALLGEPEADAGLEARQVQRGAALPHRHALADHGAAVAATGHGATDALSRAASRPLDARLRRAVPRVSVEYLRHTAA